MDEYIDMKGCSRCNSTEVWRLGDGRYKCRSCNWRYSWRSVWEAIRLPAPEKHICLRAFAGDAAVSPVAISPARRQRFNLLARACCALQSPIPFDAMYIHECRSTAAARTIMRGWASARQVMILCIAEHAGTVGICPPPLSPSQVVTLLRARSALGGVLRVCDSLAYASLPIVGGYVSIPRLTHGVLATHVVEHFWHHARKRLQDYRRIPLKQLPLHLSELCFRFNRRHEDFTAVLLQLLQSTSMSDVRPLIGSAHAQHPNAPIAVLNAAERARVIATRADALIRRTITEGTHTHE